MTKFRARRNMIVNERIHSSETFLFVDALAIPTPRAFCPVTIDHLHKLKVYLTPSPQLPVELSNSPQKLFRPGSIAEPSALIYRYHIPFSKPVCFPSLETLDEKHPPLAAARYNSTWEIKSSMQLPWSATCVCMYVCMHMPI